MAFCFNKDRAKFDEFLEFVEEKKNDKGAVMPVLQEAQRLFGYIPEEIVDFMALKLNKPSSKFMALHRSTVNSLLNLEESTLYASV